MLKMIFKKIFSSSQMMQFFGKTMENVGKHNRDINLVTTEARRNYLVSEPNHYTRKQNFQYIIQYFPEIFISNRNEKKIFMNKPVYLGLAILEISEIVIHMFWYNYVRCRYGEKAKLCYMDTGSFTIYLITRIH